MYEAWENMFQDTIEDYQTPEVRRKKVKDFRGRSLKP
jgi:hypothetical protein